MQAVILAAGQCSRFWPLNYKHKSLITIMGKPLILYTLEGLEKNGFKKVVIVQNSKREIEKSLKEYSLPKIKIQYIIQKETKGMGNALWEARNVLSEKFFVVNAERVDCKDYLFLAMKKKSSSILFASPFASPQDYGILEIKNNKILRIVEKPKRVKRNFSFKIVGLYYLPKKFFYYYQKTKKEEYDFERALNSFVKKEKTEVILLKREPLSLKYPWHLFEYSRYLMDKNLKEKVEDSVFFGKNVFIEGKIFVESGAKILEGAIIKGPCYIGKNAVIGNHSLVREYVNLEKEVVIGAFAEVVRSIFQEKTTVHSGYFGDSILGEETKVGAGTIFANRRLDRKEIFSEVKGKKINTYLKFFGGVVGKNTKIGTMVNIMPGKFIGSNCFIGPQSMVDSNIADDSFFPRNLKPF